MTDRKRKNFNPKVIFKNKLDVTILDKSFYMTMLENLRELKEKDNKEKK
jgi:hypothetical protein